MAAGPLMRWRREEWGAVGRRVAIPAGIAVLALIVVLATAGGIGVLPLLGLALAIGVGVASFAPLWKRNLRRTPLFTYGMVIAHFGIAVSLAGMASESAFSKETLTAARPGETVHVGPWAIRFAAIDPVAGPNWTAVQATLEASRDARTLVLKPAQRTFDTPQTQTSESAIATRWDGQLYTVVGESVGEGRWQLRLWWKPFVTLIWAGGGLIGLGGLLSLIGRARPRHRAKPVRDGYARFA